MTSIEWTEEVWNPVTGCDKISPGCAHCYAEVMAKRCKAMGNARYANGFKVTLQPDKLDEPLRWRKPRKVFVNSMSDLFHEEVPFEFIAGVFGVMAACPQHTFQVLTKRPERMLEFCRLVEEDSLLTGCLRQTMAEEGARRAGIIWDGRGSNIWLYFDVAGATPEGIKNRRPWPGWPLPNVWLGTSVEDQERADERIPLLLQCPAAVRWISAEPLLGPVTLRKRWLECLGREVQSSGPGGVETVVAHSRLPQEDTARCCREFAGLSWIVVGGESGQHMHQERLLRRRGLVQKVGSRDWRPREDRAEWVRSLRDQCAASSVPFFFKQWGGPYPKSGGRLLDGRTHDAYPQGGAA